MNDYRVDVLYSEEDEGYIADIPALAFCSAFGVIPEDALRELQVAKDGWLKAAAESGKPILPIQSGCPANPSAD